MNELPPLSRRRDRQWYRRAALIVLLVGSWLALLPQLWSAFSTLPSAERLEQSRMAPIPTLQALGWLVARSAGELAIAVAAAWPRARLYAARLMAGSLLLLAWFLSTPPLALSRMTWFHRRWLALLVLLLVAGWAVDVVARVWGRRRGEVAPPADAPPPADHG